MQAAVDSNGSPSRQTYEDGRVPISLSGWLPVEPLPQFAQLRDDIATDVVVIGGGLAGSSTFLHLVENGAEAVLIEAQQPANWASGRNAGHYLPYLDDLETCRHWPGGKGDRFLSFAIDNRNIVYEICDRYGLDVDSKQLGMAMVSRRPIKELAAKAQFWRQHGYSVDEVGRQDLVHLLGTANYGYGIVWREGGRMNPYLFTNGMVAAAARLGGRVFGDSPVQSCVREGNMWRVKSPEGSILARRVVVCTAGEHNQFFPELGRSNYPLVASALATRPLPSELIRQLMPSGLIVEQYPGLYHMLIDGRGRLVSSTIPAVGTAYDADMYFKIFVSWLRKSFPVASDFNIELESYWSGRMFNTSHVYQRGYPGVYRLDNGAYAFINLGSWGNFMGPLLGKSLGQALAADRPDDFVMPIDSPPRVSWPGYFDLKVRRFMVPAGRMADRLGLI